MQRGPMSTFLELDSRRRASFAEIGRKEHTRYLVDEEPDGTLIFVLPSSWPRRRLACCNVARSLTPSTRSSTTRVSGCVAAASAVVAGDRVRPAGAGTPLKLASIDRLAVPPTAP